MQQYIQFIQNHLLLCAAAIIALVAIIVEEIRGKISGTPRLNPQEATFLINRENAVICDLRKNAIFSGGHILGSINIERESVDAHIKKLEAHKSNPIILVDDIEANAVAVGNKLVKQGFAKINILAGGMVAWKDAHLPLSKK